MRRRQTRWARSIENNGRIFRFMHGLMGRALPDYARGRGRVPKGNPRRLRLSSWAASRVFGELDHRRVLVGLRMGMTISCLRFPMKPATHSNRKPATDSDLKPAWISDLMSATWRLLPRIYAMMFCPEPFVKRLGFGCPQELEWRWVTAGGARFPLRCSGARRYPRPYRAEGRASRPSAARWFHGEDGCLRKLSPARSMR